ncbi:MAG: ribosome biogenesis GTP-binding protein YihA/YsxC, partial [Proteobacteria bacterium]|nr:ribosome biogenesis GTP-binding protein YihA/YsxC [Pseudomonadota bacterium]
MNLSFLNLEFEVSHATYDQLHGHDGVEIAFVGASNAGKSSAINAVSSNKKIAKTSKKPGKTKLFNFFKIGVNYIVDFPGYGYSKTSKKQQDEWAIELPKYFQNRNNLVAAIIFTDIRHPLRSSDLQMINMLESLKVNYFIALTKADKLDDSSVKVVLNAIQENYPNAFSFSIKRPMLVSSFVRTIN